MTIAIILQKSHIVHLKPEGEICNRLKAGTKVQVVRKKGDWAFINWRGEKKRGWIIFLPLLILYLAFSLLFY